MLVAVFSRQGGLRGHSCMIPATGYDDGVSSYPALSNVDPHTL